MSDNDVRRPSHEAPPNATTDSHIITSTTTTLAGTDALAHAHAVLVLTPAGRWTRRLYLSLHGADRAMARARARGLAAQCVMVELVPVPMAPVVVVGGEDR